MVEDKPERPPTNLIRRSFRPPPLGHAWAWIIIAVSVVIMTSITLWVVVSGKTTVSGLAGRDAVHQVTKEWRERWSQVPGPPTVYVQEAENDVLNRDFDAAARRMSMALALNANRLEDWARMVCLSAIEPTPRFAMSDSQIRTIMPILEEMKVESEGMRMARSWEQFTADGGASVDAIDRCFGLKQSSD